MKMSPVVKTCPCTLGKFDREEILFYIYN